VAKISPLNIAVTVDPTGMDRGIAQAEQKLKAGARRMEKSAAAFNIGGATRGVAGAAAGALGFGGLGGALGGFGAAGLGVGALVAPLFAAAQMAEALASAVKGTNAQLQQFQQGGGVGAFGNQALLSALARIEQRMMARGERPSMLQSFLGAEQLAMGTNQPGVLERLRTSMEAAALMAGGMAGGMGFTAASEQAAALMMPEGAGVELMLGMARNRRAQRGPTTVEAEMQRHAEAMNALYQSNLMFTSHRRMEYGL
jgi:hypothetical protein